MGLGASIVGTCFHWEALAAVVRKWGGYDGWEHTGATDDEWDEECGAVGKHKDEVGQCCNAEEAKVGIPSDCGGCICIKRVAGLAIWSIT